MSPDEWLASVDPVEGSWWTSWIGWLKARSGAPGKRPTMGAPAKGYRLLGDAPGVYVLEK
jgi:polyhydroxyalkanoate synthase